MVTDNAFLRTETAGTVCRVRVRWTSLTIRIMSGPAPTRIKPNAQNPGLAMAARSTMRLNKISKISGFGTQSRINYSLANRSVMGMSSRRSISLNADSKATDKSAFPGIKQAVPIYDDAGNNVAPHPLFQAEPGAVPQKPSKLFTPPESSGVAASDIFSSVSFQQTGISSSFVGPFSRSTFGGSSFTKSSRENESLLEEMEDPGYRRDVTGNVGGLHFCPSDVPVKREEVPEKPGEEDLSKIIDICLTETDTVWLLDMPPLLLSAESEEAERVRERNNAYVELCKSRAGNDRYVERSMQTFNGAPKSKEVQCERIGSADAGVMASAWDLYDSFNSPEIPPAKVLLDAAITSQSVASSQTDTSRGTGSVSSIDRGDVSSSTVTEIDRLSVRRIPEENVPDGDEILKSEKFQQDLFFMERIVVENIFQPKLAAYRQLPVFADPEAAVETNDSVAPVVASPSLDRLWSFVCDVTKSRNVSSCAWNKKNPDLLAVGYGQFGFKEQKGGLACCWSLKNTMWPERIFHCESGVTALDFSASSPNLLAVGMYDGTVAIFNVQNSSDTPVLDSSDNPNKHTCPVWQLKWIERHGNGLGEDKGEILVSISADGRITKWRIRKGLDCSDLMKLKRTGSERTKKSAVEKENKSEAFISRQAPGMCFDFHPKDSNIYLSGTEEGHIHKCSCSYNEQFLDTYRAHKGPVYKITWSPFCPDVFLSCSADWAVHLWRQDVLKPVLSFSTSTSAVYDIMWSPSSPLVFGAVTENGVEIWDLGVSTLDPVVASSANPGVRLTTILFAKNTNCVLVGDSDGQVNVYELRNAASTGGSEGKALYDIIEATLASQL
ncbi:dynein axonemal intermediate chain 4 [Spea bombifrons]|uniref:dynein axonemal intermediate chain 4 n=1 Tax=Spea bombifrons TaxID=233779 RepID=UPI002349EBBF|nr:dynein axonemal intermediate chain 4 [Spea bombifrons]